MERAHSVRAEITTEKAGERPTALRAVADYIRDVRVEMSKVSWPTRRELRDSTLVVIVMVFVVAIFIGVVDRGLTIAFEALIRMVG
jgi:preprotein translocase subunit SecE